MILGLCYSRLEYFRYAACAKTRYTRQSLLRLIKKFRRVRLVIHNKYLNLALGLGTAFCGGMVYRELGGTFWAWLWGSSCTLGLISASISVRQLLRERQHSSD